MIGIDVSNLMKFVTFCNGRPSENVDKILIKLIMQTKKISPVVAVVTFVTRCFCVFSVSEISVKSASSS
jgi:hypothetical protein